MVPEQECTHKKIQAQHHCTGRTCVAKQPLAITLFHCTVQFCGALFNLGKALGMQGRADEARKAYGQAIEVLCLCQ